MKYMEALLLTHKGRNHSRKYNLSSSYLELKIAKPSDTRWLSYEYSVTRWLSYEYRIHYVYRELPDLIITLRQL